MLNLNEQFSTQRRIVKTEINELLEKKLAPVAFNNVAEEVLLHPVISLLVSVISEPFTDHE